MKYFIQIILTIAIFLPALHATAEEVPDELKTLSGKLIYLASLARDCNVSLENEGETALSSSKCRHFSKTVKPVYVGFFKQKKHLVKWAYKVENSEIMAEKLSFQFFMDEISQNTDTINKVREQINLMSD